MARSSSPIERIANELGIGAFDRPRRRYPDPATVRRRSILYRAACRGIRAPEWVLPKWRTEYVDAAMAFGEAVAAEHVRRLQNEMDGAHHD